MIYPVVREVSKEEIPWFGTTYGGPGYPEVKSVNGAENLQVKTVRGLLESFVDGDRAEDLESGRGYDDSKLGTWAQQAADYAAGDSAVAALGEDTQALAAEYGSKMISIAVAYSTPLPVAVPSSAPAGSLVGLTWVPPGGLHPVPLVWSAASASAQIGQLHDVLTDALTRLAAAETDIAALKAKLG